MLLILILVKIMIIFLIFRYVATPQELNFNPVGKSINLFTSYLFKSFKQPKEQTDRYIPLMVVGLIILTLLLEFVSSSVAMRVINTGNVLIGYIRFLAMFLIVSVLLSLVVKQTIASYYFVYFYRIGTPWMRFTRKFIPIDSSLIILPTCIVILIVYILLSTGILMVIDMIYRGGISDMNYYSSFVNGILESTRNGLLSIVELLRYLTWIVIARSLLTWVSPNPTAPIVQIVYALTEPILAPFRRIIPPVGMIDLSALAVVVFLWFSVAVLEEGVKYLF